MTIDVFISYAKEDHKFARRLAAALERPPRGWSVWWDIELTTGERFSEEIRQAIEASRCVLVLWSKHSVVSDWVAAEAEVGRERGVLVPILIDDCDPPMPFGPIHSANLKAWRGSESALEWSKLLDAIQSAFSRGPEVSDAERVARQERMSAVKQRRWRMRAAAVVVAALVFGGGWVARNHFVAAHEADALAAIANELREEVLSNEENKIWWWHLFDNRPNYEKLEASWLVAQEAMSISATSAARDALNDTFALMPWSEHGAEIQKKYRARKVAFSPDGSHAITAGALGETIVWNVADASVVARIDHGNPGDEEWIRERGWGGLAGGQMADFNQRGDLIATAGLDHAVRLWAIDGSSVGHMMHGDVTLIVLFSPVEGQLASMDTGGVVRLWEVKTGALLQEWQHPNTRGRLQFSASGELLASINGRGDVVVWDTQGGAEVFRNANEQSNSEAIVFGPGDRQLTIYDMGVTIWNLDSGEAVRTLVEDQAVYSAIYAKNDILVVGGADSLQWWNHETGDRLFTRDAGAVIVMAVDADEETLLTLTFSHNEAQAWDLATGRLLRRMPYARFIHAAAIEPGGEWMAVTGSDWYAATDVIEFASIRAGDLTDRACDFVGRNLSRDEWDEYIGNRPYRKICPDIDED